MRLKTILAIGLLAVLAFFVVREFVDFGSDDSVAADEQIENAQVEETGLQIGETAPDFTLTNMQGEPMTLSDYRGSKVILNFWASWCGPCQTCKSFMKRHKMIILKCLR